MLPNIYIYMGARGRACHVYNIIGMMEYNFETQPSYIILI